MKHQTNVGDGNEGHTYSAAGGNGASSTHSGAGGDGSARDDNQHQTEWEKEFDEQFYSNTNETCTWHRNTELKSFIATLITEEYERGVKFAEGMAIHEGEERERNRVVEILAKQMNDEVSIDRRLALKEALLAITKQDQ